MATVTVQNIVDDAQLVHLGDEQSEIFDDAFLLTYFASAYRLVLSDIRQLGTRLVRRKTFARLPQGGIHTIVPGSPELPYLGTSVINISVRRENGFTPFNMGAYTIDPSGIPTYTTTVAHGRVVGDFVQVTGVVGGNNPNYEGFVTAVPSSTQVTLAIPVTPGATLSGASAGISYSTDTWFNLLEESRNTVFPHYAHRFENGRYVFEPMSPVSRQIMFEYYLEANTRTFALSDVIDEDRMRDVVALRLALIAGKNKVSETFYSQIVQDYVEAKRSLESALIKDQQREIIQRPRHHTVVTRRLWT